MAFPTSNNWFRKTVKDSLERTAAIDWNGDTFKCALYTNSITGTFDFDTNVGYGSTPWDNNEVASGGGYTTTGATCGSNAITVTAGTVKFAAANATWTTASITARGALLYDDTLTAGSKYGIVAIYFGASDVISTGGTFQITWSGSGILTFA